MQRNSQESFTNDNMFPTPSEVYHIIVDSGYFNNFNELNYTVRGIRGKEDYQTEIKDLNETERIMTRKLYNHILEIIEEKQPNVSKLILGIKDGLRFAKFTHKLEGNMPHTHKNIIILPEYMYDFISNNSTSESFKKHGATIIHEICHVLQRYYHSQFSDLYDKWNFHKYNISQIDHNIVGRIRVNPDGLDSNWIWKYDKQFLFLAVFKENSKSLNDVNYNYYVIENDKIVKSGDILDEKNFNKFFGIENNVYHHNEISAEYFSMYFTGKNINGMGYKIFQKWIKRT